MFRKTIFLIVASLVLCRVDGQIPKLEFDQGHFLFEIVEAYVDNFEQFRGGNDPILIHMNCNSLEKIVKEKVDLGHILYAKNHPTDSLILTINALEHMDFLRQKPPLFHARCGDRSLLFYMKLETSIMQSEKDIQELVKRVEKTYRSLQHSLTNAPTWAIVEYKGELKVAQTRDRFIPY